MTSPVTPSPSHRKNRLSAGRGRGVGVAILTFVALVVGLYLLQVLKDNLALEERPITLGATFSKPYAESLGLDWRETYLAVLDDLGVRALRIPAYWNMIEPADGQFAYDDLDWQVDQAAQRGATIVMAVGRKLPRWPECHVPDWAKALDEPQQQERVIAAIERTVRRYAEQSAIVVWQVENEPFFAFGECPPLDRAFLKREVAAVRAIDPRPIMITESGELSTWFGATGLADILGISTYRTVWDKYVGYFYWPIAPGYYVRRYATVSGLIGRAVVSELQAEPWAPEGLAALPTDEQLRLMNPVRLEENVRFARQIGFAEAYLWGVEWWYWLKTKQGRPEMWEAGKAIIRALPPS